MVCILKHMLVRYAATRNSVMSGVIEKEGKGPSIMGL